MQKIKYIIRDSLTARYRLSEFFAKQIPVLTLFILLFFPVLVIAKEKILSLDLCTDWMLAKYADRSQVLALSPLIHQYPVDWIKKDWPTHNGSIEQILVLEPDLVIAGEFNAIILRQRLKELGLNVKVLSLPTNLSEVIDYENQFLALIGLPSTVNRNIPISSGDNKVNKKQRLLLLGANGIGTGRNTFEDDLLINAGWNNYLEGNGYISLDLEELVIDPPDAILWSASGTHSLANLFANHPALKKVIAKQRWITTTPWKWRCPGPWTWDLIDNLQSANPSLVSQ